MRMHPKADRLVRTREMNRVRDVTQGPFPGDATNGTSTPDFGLKTRLIPFCLIVRN